MQRHTRDQCDVELPSRSMIDGGLEYYFCGGIFHWKSPILRSASCRRRCWDDRERQTDRQTDVNRETTRETDRPLEAHVGKLFWTCMSCELISSFPWSDDSGGKLVKRTRDRREDNVCWDYSTASTGAAATSGRARDILLVHSTTGITTNYAIKEERAKL